MNLKEKLTMLISSCENYSDLWDNHVKLLNDSWKNRTIRAMIVSDKPHNGTYGNVDVFCAGENLEMPQRIKSALHEVDTEFVLLTLDDYYPIKKVYDDKLIHAIECMQKFDLDYLRFWPYPHEKKLVNGEKNFFWIELEGNYKVNVYPAIWRRSFLEQTLKDDLNAWNYEVSLTQIAKALNAKCAYSKNDEFVILDVIRKGKILHKAKRYLDKRGMYLSREVISYGQEFKLAFMYYAKEIFPKPLLRFVKKQLVKRGHKFISDGM